MILKELTDKIDRLTLENQTLRAETIEALTDGIKLIDDMSRFVGQMSLKNYQLFNEAPIKMAKVIRTLNSQASPWRPIDSAPKDGTWISVYWPTMRIGMYPFVVYWDEGWQPAHDACREYGEVFPTHWMPVPAPPSEETRG